MKTFTKFLVVSSMLFGAPVYASFTNKEELIDMVEKNSSHQSMLKNYGLEINDDNFKFIADMLGIKKNPVQSLPENFTEKDVKNLVANNNEYQKTLKTWGIEFIDSENYKTIAEDVLGLKKELSQPKSQSNANNTPLSEEQQIELALKNSLKENYNKGPKLGELQIDNSTNHKKYGNNNDERRIIEENKFLELMRKRKKLSERNLNSNNNNN